MPRFTPDHHAARRRGGAGAGDRRGRAGAALPHAAHRGAARPVPLQRRLRGRGHQRRRRQQQLSRPRGHALARAMPTTDPASQGIYLRDVGSGAVWSAGYHPAAVEPDEYLATFTSDKATLRRRDGDVTTQLDVAVSPEDDVEVRRLTLRHHGHGVARDRRDQLRRDGAGAPSRRPGPPGIRQALRRDRVLAEQHRPALPSPARATAATRCWAVHVLSVEGRPQGAVEWESDRLRFIGRGRTLRSPVALDGRALSGTTGVVLDPVCSLRQRVRLVPGGQVRLSFATGVAPDREAALALAQKYHHPGAASRTFALAFTHAQSLLHHLGCSPEDARLFERLASSLFYADESGRAPAEHPRRQHAGPVRSLAARAVRRPADPAGARRRPRRRRRAGASGAAGPGVPAAQGPARRCRHPERGSDQLSRRAAGAARCRCSTRARGAPGCTGRAAPTCCAATTSPRPTARCSTRSPGSCCAASAAICAPRWIAWWRRRVPPRHPVLGAGGAGRSGPLANRTAAGPGARAAHRPGWIRRGRPRVRRHPRWRPGDADAVGQRHRQPALRHYRDDLGGLAHLGDQQPRTATHPVCQRPGRRSDGRGPVPARRRIGRRLVADARAAAP